MPKTPLNGRPRSKLQNEPFQFEESCNGNPATDYEDLLTPWVINPSTANPPLLSPGADRLSSHRPTFVFPLVKKIKYNFHDVIKDSNRDFPALGKEPKCKTERNILAVITILKATLK